MNTRFNPTCNGRLHLGHLYLVLLNYDAARSTGGRFIVRFDDDQLYWVNKLGRRAMEEFSATVFDDLEWMGIDVDLYSSEAAERKANEGWLNDRLPLLEHGEDLGFPMPQIKTCDRPYPYVPYLTAVKVAQDHREGCDLVIRGDDLVTEFSLYFYFCRILEITPPAFQYVPKLTRSGEDLSDVSKTSGDLKVADFRNRGWTPAQVVELLAESCLVDPAVGWRYDNVRLQPAIAEQRALV